MDSIRGEGYEVEFVPIKALPENKLGITFKGNGAGYLEAHKIIKSITGMTGEVLVKNGLEMTVIDTPKNKPTKIEIKYKNGVSGRVNLKIFDVNSKGGATMMVQKVSGGNFSHVKSLGIDIIKYMIDGVIEGKIQEKDIENFKRKRSQKINKNESVQRSECKKYLCDTCDKGFSTKQGLNLHIGHIHKTDRKISCDVCKQKFNCKSELEQHKLSVNTVSESPRSKKIRIDRTESFRKNEDKIFKEIEIQVNEDDFDSLMDIDTPEESTYSQKSNEEEAEKKRKRQISTEKRRKKKGEQEEKKQNENKIGNETVIESDKEVEVNLGYMGWQNDEGEGGPNDRKFVALQKLLNDVRSDVKHLEGKVNALEKSDSNQKTSVAKLNKELSSLKEEYRGCVEALRKETDERTKAESTVKVLKEIIDTKKEQAEEEKCTENIDMEIDDALGVWITQQKRKPLKIAKQKSRNQNCGECDRIFINETDLVNHIREHTKNVQLCKFCGKQFERSQMLHKHMEEHTQSSPVKCQKCNKNFTNENELAKHVAQHNANSFGCESCDTSFKSSEELQKHKDEHNRSSAIQCKKCDEIFVDKEESARHRGSCSNIQFKCNECDRNFDDNESLSKHMMTHNQVQEFKCCKCDKSYPAMNKLRRHDWRSHRNIECNICGEQLESRDHISNHRRQVHKMDKKIICKFFPECIDGDECFFIHDDALSLEKEKNSYCLDGENCIDQSCEFPEREHKNSNKTLCRYQLKCKKPLCRFKHYVEKASFLGDSPQSCRTK